mmetsp:Transcript_34650/g.92593  ORF Transcript_34650/g.92593 Transcript_34650/m.92593 type:complete len:201 (-) Transcript_34650:168-770(-)
MAHDVSTLEEASTRERVQDLLRHIVSEDSAVSQIAEAGAPARTSANLDLGIRQFFDEKDDASSAVTVECDDEPGPARFLSQQNRALHSTNDHLRLEIMRLRGMLKERHIVDPEPEKVCVGPPVCIVSIVNEEVQFLHESLKKRNSALESKYQTLKDEHRKLRSACGLTRGTMANLARSAQVKSDEFRAAVQEGCKDSDSV